MILHITTHEQWREALFLGVYHAASQEDEGFIHCSTEEQILQSANAYYHGQTDLLLLCISSNKVEAPILFEDSYQKGAYYPHIYGSLNLDAVVQTFDFPPNNDGSFTLPDNFYSHLPISKATGAALNPGSSRTGSGEKMNTPYAILEFDPTRRAILEPDLILPAIDIAEHCVLCFFQDVITELKEAGRLEQIFELGSERGPNPVYEMMVDGRRLAVMHAGVGAPVSAAFMDELIALGCRKFIACGGCGVLDERIGLGQVVIPVSAVRDEGTSYHYLPPAREVTSSPEAVSAIQTTLDDHHVPYLLGKTWTTDGIYRETAAKMAARRLEGCLTVEMETAAFCAVAIFRGVTFSQILYGGDDLTGDQWDRREWQKQNSTRQKLFWLAAESCLKL